MARQKRFYQTHIFHTWFGQFRVGSDNVSPTYPSPAQVGWAWWLLTLPRWLLLAIAVIATKIVVTVTRRTSVALFGLVADLASEAVFVYRAFLAEIRGGKQEFKKWFVD